MAQALAELTLLIWNESPDQLMLYLIPKEESDKYRAYLDKAHNCMINAEGWENNEGLKFLNAALCDNKEDGTPDQGFEEYLSVFADFKYKYADNPITGTSITRVYTSGFYL